MRPQGLREVASLADHTDGKALGFESMLKPCTDGHLSARPKVGALSLTNPRGSGRPREGPWLCRNQETTGRAFPDTSIDHTAMGQTVWRDPATAMEIQVSPAKRLLDPGWHVLSELQ